MNKEQKPDIFMPRCPPRQLLRGQKALVTGASSGIGRSVALALGQAGADVMVNYASNQDTAEQVVDELKTFGRRALSFQADVSREEQVQAMFEHLLGEFGAIDILVNNAGVQRDAPFDELSIGDWQQVLDINLTGQFLCAREAVRAFKHQGVRRDISCAAGKIICMSSVHEVIPWAGHANYAASKGGVMLMMKSLAQEVAPFHIRVNSIAPGAIRTRINQQAWDTSGAYQSLLDLIPYGRIGEPEDIARLVAWLASDESDYIQGTSIVIDGGMTLYPGFRTGG